MPATVAANYKFLPKVWSDHAKGYFDKKLVLGQFALRNRALAVEGRGVTVNFPYFGTIGPAEVLAEDQSMSLDNLTDDSFTATVFEVGKGIGATKTSFMVSAARSEEVISEILEQLGRVHAELVDGFLQGEITSYDGNASAGHEIGSDESKYDNLVIGYKAAAAGDTMTPAKLLQAKTRAFGDKHQQTQVCFMHSLQVLDLMTDQTSGFLKADANDPYSFLQGFSGRLFGTVIVANDQVPKLPGKIGGKDAYLAHFHKANAYGVIEKEEIQFEEDKDVLARKQMWASTQWFGVKSFDRKISNLDNKSGGLITTVNNSLAGSRASE